MRLCVYYCCRCTLLCSRTCVASVVLLLFIVLPSIVGLLCCSFVCLEKAETVDVGSFALKVRFQGAVLKTLRQVQKNYAPVRCRLGPFSGPAFPSSPLLYSSLLPLPFNPSSPPRSLMNPRGASTTQVAPSEYMVRPPQPPVYMFVIDVSQPAVASGMLYVAAETIKACLDDLPGEERTMVSRNPSRSS